MLARGGLALSTLMALVMLAACGGGASSPASSAGGSSSAAPASPGEPSGTAHAVATPMPPASPIAGWTKFVPTDKSFEIQMPGLATELKTQLQTATSSIPYTLEMVMHPDGLTGFLVAWADYPAGSAGALSGDVILAVAQANDLADIVGGTLAAQTQVTLAGYSGRTWVVTYPSGRTESHAYLVGARVYVLKAVSAPTDDPAIAADFFGSFRLTP